MTKHKRHLYVIDTEGCIYIFIPSLEELKDLIDKPEVMDAFLVKLESVSLQSVLSPRVSPLYH